MINGAHVVLYTSNPEADRVFFCDILKFPSVDAGHGWLIFALPTAEAAFHDIEKDSNVARVPSPAITRHEDAEQEKSNPPARHELYLMCDDIAATLRDLKAKKVPVSEVNEQRWGSLATLTLPSGSKLGIYQPKHAKPPHQGYAQDDKVV
jgi:catechol 2,3-dioxygenase-like lactoylglutathione lyase family enzyme